MSNRQLLGDVWFRHDNEMPTLVGDSDKINHQIWFKSKPLTAEFCQRVVQLQLCTDSHDQGWASDKSQGSWSWFEIVVFADAETDEIKRTKDGTRMEYKSHANQLAHHLDRTMHYGLMFDRRTQLLANIEAGDVLAVRACVRFLSWKNYGYSAFITTRMLKEDLFPTDLWTLNSTSIVTHKEHIKDGAYQYSAPTGCHVVARDSAIASRIWFATPEFDADMINRLESIQLCTRARHQRGDGEASCVKSEDESFSWFDIVILESRTDTKPKVVNGVSMVWLSHKNTCNYFDKDATAGELFDEPLETTGPFPPVSLAWALAQLDLPEDTDVSQLSESQRQDIEDIGSPSDIEPSEPDEDVPSIKSIKSAMKAGNAIGVRVCAQFADWEAYAESGYLVIRISNQVRHADIAIPDLSQAISQATRVQEAIIKFEKSAQLPKDVTAIETPSVTILNNEIRADQVVGKDLPPQYSDTERHRPLRLLSLDGGGVRGVSELRILRRIMDSMTKVWDQGSGQDRAPHPHEVFDLIAGTSAGGLIAMMLGRLEMSIEECEEAFKSISQKLFGHLDGNVLTQLVNNPGLAFLSGSFMYAAEPLVAEVKALVKEHLKKDGAGEDEKLFNQDRQKRCKVFVVTCRANQTDDGRQFVQLRSYPTPQDMPEEYTFPEMKIWEAARATSAAPAYFDQLRIGEDRFIDGGMVYNNPVPLVLSEVGALFGYDRPIGCLLSLGTGVPVNLGFSDGVAPISDLIAMLTNSEKAHHTAIHETMSFQKPGMQKYVRLNLSKALSDAAQSKLPPAFIEKRRKIFGFIPFFGTTQVAADYVQMIKDMANWQGIEQIQSLTDNWLEYEYDAIKLTVEMLCR